MSIVRDLKPETVRSQLFQEVWAPLRERERIRLRNLLADGLGILAGGRAATSYRRTVERINTEWVTDLPNLSEGQERRSDLNRNSPLLTNLP